MQSVSSLPGRLQMECPTQMCGVRTARFRSSALPSWMVGPEQNCELSLQATHMSPESTAGLSGGSGTGRDLLDIRRGSRARLISVPKAPGPESSKLK